MAAATGTAVLSEQPAGDTMATQDIAGALELVAERVMLRLSPADAVQFCATFRQAAHAARAFSIVTAFAFSRPGAEAQHGGGHYAAKHYVELWFWQALWRACLDFTDGLDLEPAVWAASETVRVRRLRKIDGVWALATARHTFVGLEFLASLLKLGLRRDLPEVRLIPDTLALTEEVGIVVVLMVDAWLDPEENELCTGHAVACLSDGSFALLCWHTMAESGVCVTGQAEVYIEASMPALLDLVNETNGLDDRRIKCSVGPRSFEKGGGLVVLGLDAVIQGASPGLWNEWGRFPTPIVVAESDATGYDRLQVRADKFAKLLQTRRIEAQLSTPPLP
eukprot:TRINITY_DN17488_c0_g1_i1.p1 TRINITY_DN17488_c0_g1~~TRINITY_DN17488_c0_g1_i1.p1  ORF type:complete len:336 (-),score=51.15 TRINITY_DN17488_c0_g1_i1:492-1499(-)